MDQQNLGKTVMQKRSSFLIATVIVGTLLQACSGSNSAEDASGGGTAATAEAEAAAADDDAGAEPGESLAFEWSANGFEQLPAEYQWTGSGRRDEGFEPNFSLSVPETDDVIWSSGCMAGGKVKTAIYFTRPSKMQGNRATLRFETDKSPRTLAYEARYVADGQMDGFELVQSVQDPMFAEMRTGTWAYVHIGEGADGTKLRIALSGAARGLGSFLPACSGAKTAAATPRSAPVLYACDDAQAFDAVHAKRCIDNRHIILTHFGGAARVPIGHGGIADEGVQPLGITILGHELPADKRLERRAIAELAA